MRSPQICQEIIKYLDGNTFVIKKIKGMVIGQTIKLKGKVGKILAFAILNGQLLIWLEMEISSRFKVLSNGIVSSLTLHCGIQL